MTRLNQWLANASSLSRRAADQAISDKRVTINGQPATLGQQVTKGDEVLLDGSPLTSQTYDYYMLNKPVGYVCSRTKQGNNPTIYELIPPDLHHLNPVGRLDKDSSGLLLLTNNGTLANQLMHPSQEKEKRYLVHLDKKLSLDDHKAIERGVELEDGISKFKLRQHQSAWLVTMHEGRNRQIRRTFAALGYNVQHLERISFGKLQLAQLAAGALQHITLGDIK
jgi:23S rRNA pseudouridine2605 synthase